MMTVGHIHSCQRWRRMAMTLTTDRPPDVLTATLYDDLT
jgi:hypothetical protein